MHTHFFQNTNLRKIILEKRPEVLVECGAGNGDCTKLLAHLRNCYPFRLISITDKVIPDIPGVEWQIGISYKKLKEFPDNSIGLCIIDTDHNFWTLEQELEVVKNKMVEGGLIVMHDVETFYHDTGMGMSYWDDSPYPEKEIMAKISSGGLADALLEFLVKYKGEYKLIAWSKESHGCAVIEKKTVTHTNLIQPGENPVFAKKR